MPQGEDELESLRAAVSRLEREAAAYRALLDAVPDLIIRLSMDGTYRDFIEAKNMEVVMSRAARLDRSVHEVLPPEIADQYVIATRAAIATGQTQSFEYAMAIDNRLRHYEARVVKSGDDDAILVVRDVSARHHMMAELRREKERSEQLLLNVLPRPIVEQLKRNPSAIADGFEQATILFADIVGFTQLASSIPPAELVRLLNDVFTAFDGLADRLGLEKIKTIGDAYMVVGGIPTPRQDHAAAMAEMALGMLDQVQQIQVPGDRTFRLRIGMHSGPVVAGVIGTKKFIYDLWGDAVNIASRMESHGLPGCIQVTGATRELLKDRYDFEDRGIIAVRSKGEMQTYLLRRRRAPTR